MWAIIGGERSSIVPQCLSFSSFFVPNGFVKSRDCLLVVLSYEFIVSLYQLLEFFDAG
jgi:hypothetical protein